MTTQISQSKTYIYKIFKLFVLCVNFREKQNIQLLIFN